MSDEINRAQRAQMILNDDLFKEAVQALRDKAVADFRNASPSDPGALLHARVIYEVTESFINVFHGYVREGQMAEFKKPKPKVETHNPHFQ